MRPLPLGIALALLAELPAPAGAVDGVREINQTCAVQTGCFSGDPAGFPVVIDGTAGQSYRLTSDLQLPDENTGGITVLTDLVSVDLNGFAIRGITTCTVAPTVCSPIGFGIGVHAPTVRGTELRNGSIVGTGSSGLLLGPAARVLNVRVAESGFTGIQLGDASGVLVDRCTVFRNRVTGIEAGVGSTVANSVVYENGGAGILMDEGGVVIGNTSNENDNVGIFANTSDRVTVESNTVRANASFGIAVGAGSVIKGNSASLNAAVGIRGWSDSLTIGNAVYDNGQAGISCSAGGCAVHDNTASFNGGSGLSLSPTSGYRGNVVRGNTGGTVAGGVDLGGNLLNP